MTDAKKPVQCDCWLCKLNPWLWGGFFVLPFAGVVLGAAGIFTDVGGDQSSLRTPTPVVRFTVENLNGMWVTYTPTPTVAAAAGVPERGVGVPIIVRDVTSPAAAPIVAVVTVVVERVPLGLFPTPVPTATTRPSAAPTAVPTACVLPPGLCKARPR